MKIGGYLPLSLCDFPGCVAAVVFTQGCNFRCPFCHNGHLLPETPAADAPLHAEPELLGQLAARRGRLGGVVISGGEPTLQSDLEPFIRRVRDLGLAVKLDTNGSRPRVLAALLSRGLLDYVAMDIKAPWHAYEKLTGVRGMAGDVRESMTLLAASGVAHQFRTTHVTPLLSEDDCRVLMDQIPSGSRHTWQTFKPAYALEPALWTEVGERRMIRTPAATAVL